MIDLAGKEFPFECWTVGAWGQVYKVTLEGLSAYTTNYAIAESGGSLRDIVLFEQKSEAIEAGMQCLKDYIRGQQATIDKAREHYQALEKELCE